MTLFISNKMNQVNFSLFHNCFNLFDSREQTWKLSFIIKTKGKSFSHLNRS